jgi:hypothetical protein
MRASPKKVNEIPDSEAFSVSRSVDQQAPSRAGEARTGADGGNRQRGRRRGAEAELTSRGLRPLPPAHGSRARAAGAKAEPPVLRPAGYRTERLTLVDHPGFVPEKPLYVVKSSSGGAQWPPGSV